MIEEANFPHGECVRVVCCGHEDQGKLSWVSVSVIGNNKPLVIPSLTLWLQVVLCRSMAFLTVFAAQDSPACQGRLCLFLYSHCVIAVKNPAMQNPSWYESYVALRNSLHLNRHRTFWSNVKTDVLYTFTEP